MSAHDEHKASAEAEIAALRFRIAELERAAEGRVLAEHRLEATLNAMPDLLFEVDPAGRIQGFRVPAGAFLFAPPESFLGKPVHEVLPPEVADIVIGGIAEASAGGRHVGAAYSLPMPNGVRWFELSVAARGGPEPGVVVLARDITDRRLAEDKLRRSEEDLRESQSVARVGSYLADFVAGTWTSSEALDEIFGIDPGYVRTVPGWLELIHPDDRDMMSAYLADEVLGQGRPFEKDYRIRRHVDGATRWVAGRGRLKFGAGGEVVSMLGTIHDVSDRREMESRLLQSQKMEAVGRLAGGVAHDFNNMLAVILGHAELALDRIPHGQPLRADIESIRVAAERSANLTRQLLAFARKQVADPRVLDLNSSVEGMLKMLRRLIGEDIDLAWSPVTAAPKVRIDPAQLDQILANLCLNARDAITGAGRISIETGTFTIDEAYCAGHPGFKVGRYAVLAVTDTGRGMDSEEQSHLFEPFYTTKQSGRGTGLGLATVYGLVMQNQGFIHVYSEPGRGTCFRIYLALQEGDCDRPASPVRDDRARGRECILVVDDDPTVLAVARRVMESRGYEVLAASSGDEAIRLLREDGREPQLLLTDVIMPGGNGRDLALLVQAERPALKVIFMSGYTGNVIAHHGVLEAGMNFIQKPFASADLAGLVRQVLDEGA
jgi:PAS domain S-box-containing protein